MPILKINNKVPNCFDFPEVFVKRVADHFIEINKKDAELQ